MKFSALKIMGRFCLSALFIVSAVSDVLNWLPMTMVLTNKGVPFSPFLLGIAVLLKLAGGSLLALGIKVRWAVAALVLFLLPTTFIFHDFWAAALEDQSDQFIHFLKNWAILGGLFILAAEPESPSPKTKPKRRRR
jgi:putative oxidoreductase